MIINYSSQFKYQDFYSHYFLNQTFEMCSLFYFWGGHIIIATVINQNNNIFSIILN